MLEEVKIPEVGESIYEAQIVRWLKQKGDWAEKDEDLAEIETDKATVRVAAPASGVIAEILKEEGEICPVGEVIARLDPSKEKPDQSGKERSTPEEDRSSEPEPESEEKPRPERESKSKTDSSTRVMPAAARLLSENRLSADQVKATGPGGRLLKEDVLRHLNERDRKGKEPAAGRDRLPVAGGPREEEIVPMSMIRRRVADRLVEAQNNAALLTTINEIDMSAVIELRRKYKEAFQEKYGVKLGFMSLFVKAAVEGLKAVPQLNAEIRGRNILYRNYYDVGIAIGAGKGLVVPVLRNSERMSFAEIERAIGDFASRAGKNEITPEELDGGTFSITNGGVYGSLLSTPIVNPPQSGILGLHAIQERPVAREGQVVIRPMMYVALTYDHRIVDGREAIGFLRRVKEIVEDPPRMILEI